MITDEQIKALDPIQASYWTQIGITGPSYTMSEEQWRVLRIAIRNGGFVAAGKGARKGSVERVSASTIRALCSRGILTACLSPDGGYAARLSARSRDKLAEHVNKETP